MSVVSLREKKQIECQFPRKKHENSTHVLFFDKCVHSFFEVSKLKGEYMKSVGKKEVKQIFAITTVGKKEVKQIFAITTDQLVAVPVKSLTIEPLKHRTNNYLMLII